MELEKQVDQMDRTLGNTLEQVVALDAAIVADCERAAIQMESLMAEIDHLKKRIIAFNDSRTEKDGRI
jgi:hypothetical protein